MKKYLFKLPIGDWSDDGHGKCDWFVVEANKPLSDIFKAYFAAVDKLEINVGEEVCESYGEPTINPDIYKRLQDLGWKKDLGKSLWLGSDGMVDLVLWFLKEGDPELILELKEEEVPSFINWNRPEGSPHLPSFGYGLFD